MVQRINQVTNVPIAKNANALTDLVTLCFLHEFMCM